MAKSTMPVNFKDDIINSAMGGKRRYRMINYSDGTFSLEDVTTYDQVGSTFGAAQMNATNKAVNAAADASKIIDDIDAIRAATQAGYMAGALALKQVDDSLAEQPQFVYDETGKITGYTTKNGGADTVFPFKSGNLDEFTFYFMCSGTQTGGFSIPRTLIDVMGWTKAEIKAGVNVYTGVAHTYGVYNDNTGYCSVADRQFYNTTSTTIIDVSPSGPYTKGVGILQKSDDGTVLDVGSIRFYKG